MNIQRVLLSIEVLYAFCCKIYCNSQRRIGKSQTTKTTINNFVWLEECQHFKRFYCGLYFVFSVITCNDINSKYLSYWETCKVKVSFIILLLLWIFIIVFLFTHHIKEKVKVYCNIEEEYFPQHHINSVASLFKMSIWQTRCWSFLLQLFKVANLF